MFKHAWTSADIGNSVMLGCYAKHSLGVSHDGNGWEGIRTPGALRHTRFPGVHNRPLCHPSIKLFLSLVIPSIVEGSRNVSFKVALRDLSAPLGMTGYSCRRRNNSSSGS